MFAVVAVVKSGLTAGVRRVRGAGEFGSRRRRIPLRRRQAGYDNQRDWVNADSSSPRG